MLDKAKRLARLTEKPKEQPLKVKRGTVKGVNGNVCMVLVDGDAEPSAIPLACDVTVGGRVIVLCDGTVWAVTNQYR